MPKKITNFKIVDFSYSLLKDLIFTTIILLTLFLTSSTIYAQNIQGVVPVAPPSGGFGVDGDAYANFPTSSIYDDVGDWFYDPGLYDGPGRGLIDLNTGLPIYPTRTIFLQDPWNTADPSTFTTSSKIDDDPNSYTWGTSNNLLAKNNLQNVAAHFAWSGTNETGDLWCIFAADRQVVNGDAYIDFEFLQEPMTITGAIYDPDGLNIIGGSGGFLSSGPDGGRTLGDILVTLIFTNGGTAATVEIREWMATGKQNQPYEYVLMDNSNYTGDIFATNNTVETSVPFDVYGTNPGTYAVNQWAEGAVNLTALFHADTDPCVQISTLFVRTKTSQSPSAELKDFPGIFQLELDLRTLEVACPADKQIGPCDADLATKFSDWKDSFSYSGAIGSVTEQYLVDGQPIDINNLQAPSYCDGGSVTVTYKVTDDCGTEECTSTFTVVAPDDLTLSTKPTDVTTLACVDPTAQFEAWIDALNGMSASGGCNAVVEYSVTPSYGLLTAGLCDAGQVIEIDINAKDDCGSTTPVTATFTVPAYTDDLTLSTKPTDVTTLACVDPTAQFEAWIDALNGMSASGGCNAVVEYSVTPSYGLLTAGLCDAGQVIEIDINAKDDCGSTTPVTATFTVPAYTDDLTLSTKPTDVTTLACVDPTAQFEAWIDALNGMSASGGCNAVVEYSVTPSYGLLTAGLCDAGQVIEIDINAKDDCGSTTPVTATFTVPAYTDDLTLSTKPTDVTTLACVDPTAQFEAWIDALNGMSASGGCNAVVEYSVTPSYGLLTAGLCDAGQVIEIDINAKDDCGSTTPVTATFIVPAYTDDLTLSTKPTDVTTLACVDPTAQFEAWIDALNGMSASGGCNAVVEYSVTPSYGLLTAGLCDAGQVIEIDINAKDDCGSTTPVTATFTVPAYTDDLTLSTKPTDVTTLACVDPTAQFEAWIDALNGMSASGGCNAVVEYSVTPSYGLLTAGLCDAGQVIEIDINAKDDCGSTTPVTATFTVPAYTDDLTLSTKPTDVTTLACVDPTAQFEAWIDALNGMSASGGCNAVVEYSVTPSYGLLTAGLCDAGQVIEIDINAKDDCGSTTPVTATFTVPAYTDDLTLSTKPTDVTTLACVDPTAQFEAWIDALNGMSASGGCNAVVEYSVTPSYGLLTAGLCDAGQVIEIDINAKDDCGSTTPVTATFIVPAYTDDLTLSTKPTDVTTLACVDPTAQFEAWIDALNGMSASGGCNAVVEYSVTPSYGLLTAGLCDAGQVIEIDINAKDDCGSTTPVTATFTVPAYTDDLTLSTKPTDVTTLACVDPTAQFEAWIDALNGMSASGGCNAVVEYSVTPSYGLLTAGLCDAGQVIEIDINAKDDCGSTTPVTATFTVPAYTDDLVVNCAPPVDMEFCCSELDEQAIKDAYDAWVKGFSFSGGCNASEDGSAPSLPTIECGTTIDLTYNYSVTDDCKTKTCTSTFKVVINDNPSCSITGDTFICPGETSSFTASGGVSYVWYFDGNKISETASTGDITLPGEYTVYVTDANGCMSSCSETLEVGGTPLKPSVTPYDYCTDEAPVSYAAFNPTLPNGVSGTIVWYENGNPILPEGTLPTVKTIPGTYTFVLQILTTDGCITSSGQALQFEVYPLPIVEAGSPFGGVCSVGGSVTLPTTAASDSRLVTVSPDGGWWSGDYVSFDGINYVFTVPAEGLSIGNYTVTYTFTDGNGCENSDTTYVPVVGCTECDTAFGVALNADKTAIDESISTCFREDGFRRWGWTNTINPGNTYTLDLYRGAAQCLLDKGEYVGYVTVTYSADYYVTAVFTPKDDKTGFDEIHLYVGCNSYPQLKNGNFTVAPGSYTFVAEGIGFAEGWSTSTDAEKQIYVPNGGEVHVIAHVVACTDTSEEVAPNGFVPRAGYGEFQDNPPTADAYEGCVVNVDPWLRLADDGKISVYPVPFKDLVNVTYKYDYDTTVKIETFDIKGTLVRSTEDKQYVKGTIGRTTIDLSNADNQMYFVRVTTARGTQVKKVVSSGLNKQ